MIRSAKILAYRTAGRATLSPSSSWRTTPTTTRTSSSESHVDGSNAACVAHSARGARSVLSPRYSYLVSPPVLGLCSCYVGCCCSRYSNLQCSVLLFLLLCPRREGVLRGIRADCCPASRLASRVEFRVSVLRRLSICSSIGGCTAAYCVPRRTPHLRQVSCGCTNFCVVVLLRTEVLRNVHHVLCVPVNRAVD